MPVSSSYEAVKYLGAVSTVRRASYRIMGASPHNQTSPFGEYSNFNPNQYYIYILPELGCLLVLPHCEANTNTTLQPNLSWVWFIITTWQVIGRGFCSGFTTLLAINHNWSKQVTIRHHGFHNYISPSQNITSPAHPPNQTTGSIIIHSWRSHEGPFGALGLEYSHGMAITPISAHELGYKHR